MSSKKSASTSIVKMDNNILKRVLGVFDLFAIGYGDLGSSIYYALGITALYALGATPIALGLAGLVFVCTALTYAEMTSTFHDTGGSASFARRAFNDLVSFISGWGLLLDYIVTIAISAFAIAPYLSYFFPDLKNVSVQIIFTVSLITLLFILNVFGIKQSTRISLFLMVITVITQVIIILIGLKYLFDFNYVAEHISINVKGAAWSPTWPDFWKGTAMAMVAYTGIESIAQLGAEAKKPAKTVPRAIVITMFVLLFMYIGISIVALSAISPQELGTKYLEDPLAGVVQALPFGSAVLSPWIGLLAAMLLFVASNAGLVGASRLAYNLGDYYQLPRNVTRLNSRFRTPVIALSIFTVLASIVVIASEGNMEFLADLYNFGAMIAFFSAHMSLIVLRIKKPDLVRPFKIPFNISFGKFSLPISAIVGALATFSVWCLVVITKPAGRTLGIAWLILGCYIYFSYRKRRNIATTASVSIERIKIPDYKMMKIKKILVPIREGLETETVQMACDLAKMHDCNLTAVHVIEVPASLPIDADMPAKLQNAELALKRAEAISRESGVDIELKILYARSISDTILEEVTLGHFDLLVLGAISKRLDFKHKGIGNLAETILKHAKCRVWICSSKVDAKAKK